MTVTPVRRKPVLLIATVAVVVAGVLAWLWWPSAESGPTVLDASTASHSVRLSIDNPKAGDNTVSLTITDSHGRAAPLDEVTVEPVMPQMGHALVPVPAIATGDGAFRAAPTALPMAGQWEITVTMRGAGGQDQVVFPLLVRN